MKRVHVSSVAPEILKARLADVVVWPCGDEGIDGIFRSNCRAPCCIVPPGGKTPDDEDSPKWERTLAQREADAEAERVLSFSPSECPTAERKFFGRRNLRLMHGQDPEKNAALFTPQQPNPMKYDWPAWPADANKCMCSRCK